MRQILVPAFVWGLTICLPFSGLTAVRGADYIVTPTPDNVRYIGVAGCQSSYCHGGASPARGQCVIWSQKDFHSRAYATLVTPRATRMAEALRIVSATESSRCTTCHAPFQMIPPAQLAPTVRVTEGVSCETCHNGAENWLRSHTRPDWTYANRVQAGMRNLRDVAVRAETCVACHQVLAPDIRAAGHPALIFELDGQTASEPRHWKEEPGWSGAKAWLVGQAVALQEMSARLERQPRQDFEALISGEVFSLRRLPLEDRFDPTLYADQQALVWLLRDALHPDATFPDLHVLFAQGTFQALPWSTRFSQSVSHLDWTHPLTVKALQALSGSSAYFDHPEASQTAKALRAERLVLGLDRLFKALAPDPTSPGQTELKVLFAAVQDREQFDPRSFAQSLRQFAAVVEPKK